MKMGGTGSKQEDQILTVGIEKATGTKFIYVPFKGGGEVAVQLVGKHVDSIGQQPDRGRGAVARRPAAGRCACSTRSACRTRPRSPTPCPGPTSPPARKPACPPTTSCCAASSWRPGVTKDQTDFYVDLLKKVRETPEWKEYMEKGAFNQTSMTGDEYVKWLGTAEQPAPRADEGSRLHRQVRAPRGPSRGPRLRRSAFRQHTPCQSGNPIRAGVPHGAD